MAITIGTNSGFVSTAPTADPADNNGNIDDRAQTTKDTSPAGSNKITEIGWWCDAATQAANFEVGLYAADGAVVPGEAGTLLFSDTTNAKGTTAGWKTVTGLNWSISASTSYWITVQLDNTATATPTNVTGTGGSGRDFVTASTLPDPFGGGALAASAGMVAIYAKYEAVAGGTNFQINIGDSWKTVDGLQINIGDTWKTVAGAQINIGDTWKTIF